MKRLLILLALLACGPAHASYDFTNGRFTGDLGVGNTVGYPLTICAWVKYTDHQVSNVYILNFGNAVDSFNESVRLALTNVDGRFLAGNVDSGGVVSNSIYTLGDPSSLDATWFPFCGYLTSDTSRQSYVDGDTDGSNTVERIVSEALRYLSVGQTLQNGGAFVGNIAEIAIWNSTLSTGDRQAYEGGTAASGIDSANLIGYWSLATDDDSPADESGNGGPTLTLNGTMDFDADHPTISGGQADWTSTPTVTDTSTTAYTVSFTTDINATVYGVACVKDSIAPTGAQIVAGDCTGDVTAKATCTEATVGGVADSCDLTVTDNPPFPVYDLHFIGCPEPGVC
jgi:hypothetical protein